MAHCIEDRKTESLSTHETEEKSWVIVSVGTSSCAIPALSVTSMVMMPHVVPVPYMPNYVRGVINLRGQVLPLVDLRTRCGMEPLSEHVEKLCVLLEQREEDHKRWLNELEKSVVERRAFTLTTDPHKCTFGKWYDQFHTDDLILNALLKKFDEPHKAIHRIAHRVDEQMKAANYDGAVALIEEARKGELFTLVNLFAAARSQIRSNSREIAIVIERCGTFFALAADKVESTEALDMSAVSDIAEVTGISCRQVVEGIAKRKKDHSMVMLLDIDAVFE